MGGGVCKLNQMTSTCKVVREQPRNFTKSVRNENVNLPPRRRGRDCAWFMLFIKHLNRTPFPQTLGLALKHSSLTPD
jgi:hypothetical protein